MYVEGTVLGAELCSVKDNWFLKSSVCNSEHILLWML